MRPGGGKAKGAAFERAVCRALSGWVSDGERDDLFWRSAMSGGRATVGATHGMLRPTQSGDISSLFAKGDIHELRAAGFMNMVVAECKFLANIRLTHFLLNEQGPIRDAWEQCLNACAASDGKRSRHPLLVVKENRGKEILITHLEVGALVGMDIHLRLHTRQERIGVVLFDEFLQHASPVGLESCLEHSQPK